MSSLLIYLFFSFFFFFFKLSKFTLDLAFESVAITNKQAMG